MRRLFLALGLLLATLGTCTAHTITFTWTWPTTNQDGSTLALSSITGATIYDTSVPAPGLPGTAVTCPVSPLPPTAATATCTTGTIAPGTHTYVIEVATAVGLGAPTAPAIQVVVPQSTPSAPTNFTATVNNP